MVEEAFPLGAIPERLKCSICTALARDAWKLACCDQTVCGSCYEQLPDDSCPICAFTPMEKDKHAEKRYKDALAKEAQSVEGNLTPSQPIVVHNIQATRSLIASVNKPAESAEGDLASQVPPPRQSPDSVAPHSSAAVQQQQLEYGNMYGSTNLMPSNLGMGFTPAMNGFPMDQMSQMMMQQMAMPGGYGGYGSNGLGWNPSMQGYPQNMIMQAQESNFHDQASRAGPSMPDYSNRGGSRGRYSARGAVRGGRGAYQAHTAPTAPVYVEGAPTGPSAMRNGTDSRGRGIRGRGAVYRGTNPRIDPGHEIDHSATNEAAATTRAEGEHVPKSVHVQSRSASVTRDRSVSPRPVPTVAMTESNDGKDLSPLRRRSPSPPTRTGKYEEPRPDRKELDRVPQRQKDYKDPSRLSDSDGPPLDSAGATKSLADRIGKNPRARSRSRSPRSERRKGRKASHRSRRNRSTSRARSASRDKDRRARTRSRSGERREGSRRDRSSRDEADHRRRRRHDDADEARAEDKSSSKRRRSRDRDGKTRRSSAKHEMGSPELRRLEQERERSRYR